MVLTQYPVAQKCNPVTRRALSNSRWILTALLPFRKPIVYATLYFGGIRPAKWRGSISIGGRVSTGNTEERRINASLNFRRRTDIDRVIGDFSYFYDEDFDAAAGKYQLDEKRGNASMQYDFFLGPEAYAWGVAQWSTDSEAEVACAA